MKRHRLDLVSLVSGLSFAALAALFLSGHQGWSSAHLSLVWPIAVIALGLALVASARRRSDPAEPPPPPQEHPEG